MNDSPNHLSPADLRRRRDSVRLGLSRVNTAACAIIVVVLGLVVTAMTMAYQASSQAEKASQATKLAQEQLWKSYLAQATAGRLSGVIGRKAKGQAALREAAKIRSSIELRNEEIAHAALIDFEEDRKQYPFQSGNTAFAYDPFLKSYAIADEGGTVRIHREKDEHETMRWQGKNESISQVIFSPDGQYLAVNYRRGDLSVIYLATEEVTLSLSKVEAIDFSANSQVIGTLGPDNRVKFLGTRSGQELFEPLAPQGKAFDLAFHPDGKSLALRLESTVQIWDWEGATILQTFEHSRGIASMALSKRYLAIGDAAGGVRAWDLKTKRSQLLPSHKSWVDALLFNREGDLLVSSSYDGFSLFSDPKTGYLLVSTTRGLPIAAGKDGKRIGFTTSAGQGGAGSWHIQQPSGYRIIDCADGSPSNVWQMDFSPDGSELAVIKGDGLRIFNFELGEQENFIPLERARSAYFSPDGHTLLTCGDNRLSLWPLNRDAGYGSRIRIGEPRHIKLPKTVHVDSAAVSLDFRKAVLPLTDTDAALIDLQSPDTITLFQNSSNPKAPTISPDLNWVVTGTFHGRGSTLWNAITGDQVRLLVEGNGSPFFSPDGKWLVVAGDREYHIFETDSWKLVKRIPTESTSDLPTCAAFSRDGHLVALVKGRQHIELVDPATWSSVARLTAPEPQILNWLTFNRDGTRLAAATAADLIQVWDLPTIRKDLAGMGLNWGDVPAKDPGAVTAPRAGVIGSPAGISKTLLAFVSLGAVSVIFCAGFVLRRQQQLFDGYMQIDQLIEQRNRELDVAQAEIMQSQKMKALGTLAAGIGHDFNNLLSVIRMSNKLIAREARDSAEIAENTAEVEKAVQQGKTVVRSMLGYSRNDADDNSPVVLPDILEDTLGLLSKQFLSGIVLNLELDSEIPPVATRRGRIEQILLNLIVNASEAMNGKGTLTISLHQQKNAIGPFILVPRASENYVELTIADSGPGMAPEVMPHIFDPFFTTKLLGASKGTGLGLSMVYTMAEMEGLGVSVETSPGKGTRFRIVVPLGVAKDRLKTDEIAVPQSHTV